ncbi:hypothetical protein B6N60_02929 [Richelia sinica FACHB-800]|uniref:Glycerophosphoryl diester phosphodiesterase membrane domain-containing protein n=1 Tax=Richelia sinica FACHB-800 TaxID=1357546 RepID=A0A975Y5G8_9NOST|nr:glycerophosphoryl diester phosphodiesterase membrane domain-containing protein [Richelia sinica]MBD2666537.1 glycerophosphoryl diester phosphodiesterase membrane domain-containing protein [Richelia sinica FACHB-800]QXE24225.1 hypothetical protein B6N60_02929 [Richelia sinica FACHB-800]
MSKNFGSPNSMQPLNVGNVVSAGLRLYRSHLKEYILLALKAHFWLLVPFYGWAKFYALSALIARLSFGELVNQPEPVESGERFVNYRIGKFFTLLFLLFGASLAIMIGLVALLFVANFAIGAIFGTLAFQLQNIGLILMTILAYIVVNLVIFLALFWIFTRFYLVDLPLAIEENVNASSSISRSWELTKGNVWRLMLISFVAGLITLPLQILVQIVSAILQYLFAYIFSENSLLMNLLVAVFLIALSFGAGALILPFWQTIKAVIYFDLRTRREGLGLQLRDREI